MASVPNNLIEHLTNTIPGFDRESKKFEVAKMLWMYVNPSRRHLKYENSINIHSDEIAAMFGRSPSFKDINQGSFRYFSVHRFQNRRGSRGSSYNNGYEPKPWMMKALLDYLSFKSMPTKLLDDKGREIKTPPKAISSKTKNNHTAFGWSDLSISSLVAVNISNLEELKEHYQQGYKFLGSVEQEKCGYKFIVVSALLQEAASNRFSGSLMHRYTQSQSGRLYAEGVNLQNCPKDIRNAALAGSWDYDINSCHFAILGQMAGMLGFDCPLINDYVQHKNILREKLSNDVAITIQQAKVVLTATIYGARMGLSDANAIPRLIGVEASKRLYGLDSYAALRGEINQAKNYILNNYPHKNGRYINKFGMSISAKMKKGSIISHLMEGVEASALHSAVELCHKDILLLQHDGFVTKNPVNKATLEERVFKDTGYHLTFDERQISHQVQKDFVDSSSYDTKMIIDEIFNENNMLGQYINSSMQTMAPYGWVIPPVFPGRWDSETPF